MKKLFLILWVLVFSASVHAAGGQPIFADMEWGIGVAAVRSKLQEKGFSTETDPDGDVKFQGNLMGHPVVGYAVLVQNRLLKVHFSIITPDRKARAVYREMKEVLTEKYGAPTNNYEYFSRPYYEGDGYEDQAIRLGKARFSSFWKNSLMLEITERLTVLLAYESPDWSSESDKRRKKRAEVF